MPLELAAGRRPPARAWAGALNALPSAKFAAARATLEACGLLPSHEQRLLAAHVAFIYGYYARLAALAEPGLRRRLHSTVSIQGETDLHEALGEGVGVVLVSAHLGEFDLAGSWLAHEVGREVVAVVDQASPAIRQRLFDSVRSRAGIRLRLRADTRLSDLIADLHHGRIVLVMLDRAAPSVGLDCSLLGRPARLSIAPVALAQRTGARVLVASTATLGSRQRVARFAQVQHSGSMHENLQALATELSRHIGACPWQWHIPADAAQLPFTYSETPIRQRWRESAGVRQQRRAA